MELRELISEFRSVTGDHGTPPLWDNERLSRLFSEAEREAAIRAKLLRDASTAQCCVYPLLTGQAVYSLHPKVWDIDPHSVTMTRPNENPQYANRRFRVCLAQLHVEPYIMADQLRTGWGDEFFLYDEASGDGTRGIHLMLNRRPAEDGGALHLSVYRLPLFDLESQSDEPEIAQQHHLGLVNWVAFRAYSTRDMEGSAKDRAADHLALFVNQFGERPDANVLRKRRRHRAVKTRAEVW